MGNTRSGFQRPPRSHLLLIKRDTSRQSGYISSTKNRRNEKNEMMTKEDSVPELQNECVKQYLLDNPEFLDELIESHVSQDRVRAWLKVCTEKMLQKVQEQEMDDEKKKATRDNIFAAEIADRSFRQRKLLIITRDNLFLPFKHNPEKLGELRKRSIDVFSEVDSHTFPYSEIKTEDISSVFLYMVTNLLKKNAFPNTELCYFLATLQENYLDLEYHNYSHALSHAQSMYWMLKSNPDIFTELEMKALMISSIAHDVGHPGVNEKYVKTLDSGLGIMYSSPVLEHHHIQICLMILQDIKCNVFWDLKSEDYKMVLRDIRHNIVSTSLTRYHMQIENMKQLMIDSLDLKNKRVKEAVKCIMMMACDLCTVWKRWPEHKRGVFSLYREFFEQGDKEISFGIEPLYSMNRTSEEDIPKFQMKFFQETVLPICQLIERIFPNLKAITAATKENLNSWKKYIA